MAKPDLRTHALDQFSRYWGEALAAGDELNRVFDDLADAMTGMAERGAHQTLVFPDDLVQEWWVAYQEQHGALIPRHPEEAPIPREAVREAA